MFERVRYLATLKGVAESSFAVGSLARVCFLRRLTGKESPCSEQ